MIAGFLQRAVMQGIPLLYGSTGEIITEKSGHLNLGIPGIMYVGAISGVIGAFMYENAYTGRPEEMNALIAVLIPFLACLLVDGADLFVFDGYASRQPKCDRSGTYHIRCGGWQLFRRFFDQIDGK